MSIQTTTPTSPTFMLSGCNSGNYNSSRITAAYSSLNTEGVAAINCATTSVASVPSNHQMNPYLQYIPQQVSPLINGGKNATDVSNSTNSAYANFGEASSSQPSSSQQSLPATKSQPTKPPSNEIEQSAICVVCGDSGAKMHYSVLACLGCKGFFRRALKKVDQYECINDNKCIINKDGRNSCRACRLRKCLDAGMNPSAVRPDRDFINKKSIMCLNLPQITKAKKALEASKSTASSSGGERSFRSYMSSSQEEWSKKLPVEMRTMLMNLLNMEVKITRGDTQRDPAEIYPLHITIREVIENPNKIKGKRTEMRYEPYRKAKNEELCLIVYRRVLAAIDWVEYLAEMVEGLSIEDRISLVKSCFAPLLLFKCSARTAMVTDKEDILCLSNFAYVPRNIGEAYADTYHLDNGLVERLITELVKPFRKLRITEEEVVCLSAIIVLNPMARDLSEAGIQKVSNLRDRIQDTMFQYIKESRTDGQATCLFGNFLLYLPLIASLSNALCENIRFAQTFSTMGSFPLLTSVFGCFPVEPLLDAEGVNLRKNVEVQTDPMCPSQGRGIKRRLPSHFVSPVENELGDEHREFRLLRPPCSYTLTEMFEDRMNDDVSQQPFPMDPQMTWPPRVQQAPSTSNVSIPNFSNSYKHPLQNSGSSKELVGSRRSFNSPFDRNTNYFQIPQELQQSVYPQPNANPPYNHPYHPPSLRPVIHHNQPSYGTYAPPPIENLTFEHREKNNL